jgi:hypothetical protein
MNLYLVPNKLVTPEEGMLIDAIKIECFIINLKVLLIHLA